MSCNLYLVLLMTVVEKGVCKSLFYPRESTDLTTEIKIEQEGQENDPESSGTLFWSSEDKYASPPPTMLPPPLPPKPNSQILQSISDEPQAERLTALVTSNELYQVKEFFSDYNGEDLTNNISLQTQQIDQRNSDQQQNSSVSGRFEVVEEYYVGTPRGNLTSYALANSDYIQNHDSGSSDIDNFEDQVQYSTQRDDFKCEKTSELLKRLNFSVFIQGLEKWNLLDILDEEDFRFTVFVPSDFAFRSFVSANDITLDHLLRDELLDKVLSYHVVPHGEYVLQDLQDGMTLSTMLKGAHLVVAKSDWQTYMLSMLSGFEGLIVYPDAHTCNAVVHVVDGVLMPDFDETGNLEID
eukprot:TRINITY_DN9204_c0_g2_i2.p1 TRINITY_DN9204_c0_g2~~TRINITY_DN9204_c0_g2_i2.p1  ORF type:complete len:353 (-),score=43.33 TRINITY_DN9204_c0_g2_i2:418-1476(-)